VDFDNDVNSILVWPFLLFFFNKTNQTKKKKNTTNQPEEGRRMEVSKN